MNDLTFAFRMLARSPGFTAAAVLTLALGIGANTTIFTGVNAILLRPLPYPEPDRLVEIGEKTRQEARANVVAYPDFLDWQEQNKAFAEMAAYQLASFNLTGADEPERVAGLRITANFFRTLGVKPALGRDFLAEEDQPGGSAVLLLSHRLWQRRFGADPAVIGQTVPLDGRGHVVVGVLPPRALAYEEADAFVPLGPSKPGLMDRGTRNALLVKGRLKPGVTRAQAQADLDVIAQRLEQQYPETNTGRRAVVSSPRRAEAEDAQTVLLMLTGSAGFVLLIACGNLASLMLARGARRSKEMAIRLALGASRARVIRQLLVESALLALAGGGAGLWAGIWGCRGLNALVPQINQIAVGGFTIDGRVLGFTMAISLLTALMFGLAPALRASKPDLQETLKEGATRSGQGLPRHRLQKALVVVQVALACVLLVGSGLLMQSLYRLITLDPGFNPRQVLTVKLYRDGSRRSDPQRESAFWKELFPRLQSLPGVVSVAAAFPMPLEPSSWTMHLYIEGRPLPAPGQEFLTDCFSVSPDYFRTLGIRLLSGRAFSPAEGAQGAKVAVINRTLAQRQWPGANPIGQRLRVLPLETPDPWVTVVGVVADIRLHALNEPPKPALYLPANGGACLIIRTESSPLSLLAAVRKQVRDLDKDQPLYDCKSLEQCMAESVVGERVTTWLLGVFAGIALALASVGIYGLVSYSVAQRTHEIGVRMALGAERRQVTRQVVGGGMKLVLVGLAAGLAAACGLTRFLSSVLYQVRPTDPATFAAVFCLLAGVALLASYLPARRAAKVDPMVALRYE